MRAGKLRHRITFQEKVEIQNPDTGEITYDWSDVAGLENIAAEIQYLSASEIVAAASNQSKVVARIIIRWNPVDIDYSMRIVHKSKIFNIEGVIPDNETGRTHITIPASYGVNDG